MIKMSDLLELAQEAAVEKSSPTENAPDLSYIIPELRPFAISIDILIPDPVNAREHDDLNIGVISDSLRQFGQDQLIVAQKQGMIVRKGNGRLLAARKLGWKYIACVTVDESEVSAVARAIADNRASETSKWNNKNLAAMLAAVKKDAPSISLGWSDAQLKAISEGNKNNKKKAEEKKESSPNPSQALNIQKLSFNLVFETKEQQDKWFSWLRKLKDKHGDLPTHAERVCKFIDEQSTA